MLFLQTGLGGGSAGEILSDQRTIRTPPGSRTVNAVNQCDRLRRALPLRLGKKEGIPGVWIIVPPMTDRNQARISGQCEDLFGSRVKRNLCAIVGHHRLAS